MAAGSFSQASSAVLSLQARERHRVDTDRAKGREEEQEERTESARWRASLPFLFFLRRRGLSWTSFFLCRRPCSFSTILLTHPSFPPPPPFSTGPALRPQRRPRPLPRPEPRPHPRAPAALRPEGAVLLCARLRARPAAVHDGARDAGLGGLLAVHQGRRALHAVSVLVFLWFCRFLSVLGTNFGSVFCFFFVLFSLTSTTTTKMQNKR